DLILDEADAIDLDAHTIAGLEESRRLHGDAYAARRAGEDHVAGLQRHRLCEVRYLRRAVEDQVLGVRVLPLLAVDEAADAEIPGIDLVSRHYERSKRRVRVERLPDRELTRPHLPVAYADVVAGAEAAHRLARARERDVPAALADHEHQLGFVVERRRHGGTLDRVK